MIIEATYKGTSDLEFVFNKRYRLSIYGNSIKSIGNNNSRVIPYTLAGFFYNWSDMKLITTK
jgi:hypothetical protein